MTKLMFLVTEDWFFRSHFVALAERAVAEGYDVSIVARMSGALAELRGVRLIEAPFARGARGPFALAREAAHLRALLARERPDIVHAIALKSIGLLLVAGAGGAGRVLAVTGRGYSAISRALWTQFASWRLRRMVRAALDAPRTLLMVENTADRAWVEGDAPVADAKVALMPGAGVDLATFNVAPESPPPIVVGVAARLIVSKGIDLAAEAVRRLRAEGLDIRLRIAGAPDPDNPEHVDEAEIARWRASEGVELAGRVTDINAFWAGVHIACLPSRGGEGLPRSLIEAAACARAIVASEAPGCGEFARGVHGLAVPCEDAAALAAALRVFATDAARRRAAGEAGRARVAAAYTTRHASDVALAAWRSVRPPP